MKEWSESYQEVLLHVANEIGKVLTEQDKRIVFVAMPGCSNLKLEHYLEQVRKIITGTNLPIARLGLLDYKCFNKKTKRPKKGFFKIYIDGVEKFLSKIDKNRIVVVDYISGIIEELIDSGYKVVPIVMKPELYSVLTEHALNKNVTEWNPIYVTESNCRSWVNDIKRELMDASIFPAHYLILGSEFEIIVARTIEAIGEDGAIQDTILSSI